jgi:subtilisin family serine protease
MRIIAIPKFDEATASLAAAEATVKPSDRRRQYDHLKKARQTRKRRGVVTATSAAAELLGNQNIIVSGREQNVLTGAFLVEGNQTDLEKMQKDLPDFHIMEDVEIDLIPPVKRGKRSLGGVGAATPTDLWHLAAVRLLEARSLNFPGIGKGITVAVLDTGVENVAEIRGKIDHTIEFDVDKGTWKKAAAKDTDGHGTHVAGLICGNTVGVAPGAKVASVIMIPGGRGWISDFILAMEYVAQQPEIAIMNMSAGIPGFHPGMRAAVRALRSVGVLPVIAVGNEGRNTSRSPGNYSEVLTVGASTKDSRVWSSSGGGEMVVDNMSFKIPDCVAPGAEVVSCVMGGGYEAWSGTSMATPIVSGIAALIIEKHPSIALADLEQEVLGACISIGAVPVREGAGLVQVPRSLWNPST